MAYREPAELDLRNLRDEEALALGGLIYGLFDADPNLDELRSFSWARRWRA